MYGCVVSTVGSNTPTCLDEGGFCAYWAATGRCSRDPGFMKEACCKSCREIAAGSTEVCQDSESSCRSWASHGDCDSNPAFMLENCCKSCKTTLCKDKHRQCSYWAFHGECTSNPSYMLKRCCKSCAAVEVPHARIHQQCVDKDVECAHWAFHGECAHNPDYMLKTCCKSCADVHGWDVGFGDWNITFQNGVGIFCQTFKLIRKHKKTNHQTNRQLYCNHYLFSKSVFLLRKSTTQFAFGLLHYS